MCFAATWHRSLEAYHIRPIRVKRGHCVFRKIKVAVLRGTLEPSEFPLADKFAVSHLRAAVLDEQEMEGGALRERGDLPVLRVRLQLRDALLALRLQLLLLRALLQVLELDDVAVWNIAVVRAFREQEEIAVAGTWWGNGRGETVSCPSASRGET